MQPPRIAFWPHTTRAAVASFRIRCAQVMEGLGRQGLRTSLWRGKLGFVPSLWPAGAAPDLIVLSKRLKDASFERAFWFRDRHGAKVVLDVSDNIFFGRDGADPDAEARRRRLAANLDRLDAIVAPSAYLADAIAAHVRPDKRLAIIPDAVEAAPAPSPFVRLTEATAFRRLLRLRDELAASGVTPGRRLVWYGISGTKKARNGLYDLDAFAEVLARHDRDQPISVTIVTDSEERYRELFSDKPFRTYFVRWNYWTFNACLRQHDVAILPVQKNDYNWAKSANRLTTGLANGLAVCASAIPSYAPFADSAVLDDWEDGLAQLMRSPAERDRRLRAGLAIVGTDYTLPAVTREWADLIADLTGR